MKKLISILVISVLIAVNSLTAVVFANTEEAVTISPVGDTITFTVDVGTGYAGYDVMAMLYRPGKSASNLAGGSLESVLAGAAQKTVGADGNAIFSFEIAGGAGFYTFTADVPRANKKFEKSIPFAPTTSVNNLILELSGMTYGDTAVARTKKLFTDTEFDGLKGEEVLGLSSADNYSVYNQMTPAQKDIFYDYLAYKFCAMDGTETKADVWNIFNKTAFVESFLSMSETDQINTMKTKAAELGIASLECYTELFAKEPYNTATNISDMITGFNASIQTNVDKDALADKFSDAMFMSVISNASTDGEVGQIIGKVINYLKTNHGLDANYENATNQKALWNLASGATTVTDFVQRINSNISFAVVAPPVVPNIGGGGGGGTVAIRPDTTVTPVPLTSAFSDIENVSWAKDAIEALAEMKVISGKEPGKFYPNDVLKREELAKVLSLGFKVGNGEEQLPEFADVDKEAWYYSYVNNMYSNGIIKGMGDAFGVGVAVTREDAATMIYRLIKDTVEMPEMEAEEFADDGEMADYAKEAIYSLKKLNILGGVGDNQFAPKKTITRAELAKIIYAIIQKGEV
ncbi:MAG: S-layer homology domain-containing protein [Ruminococcaceae bacterium]|nr:S-layer homology domain-containing protein [Oscillospiraceae bacterium]